MNLPCVLIGCNAKNGEAVRLAAKICARLCERSIGCCVCGEDAVLADTLGARTVISPQECTHVVTVGGDGTILKWGKAVAEYGLPLVGVNMGRLGFMATLEPAEAESIPQLLLGEYSVSSRMLLDCEIESGGKSTHRLVMNDVVISRSTGSKLPEFCISCGASEASRLRADGVILSTPTGSTAYSLSAGGPILAPELECIEFTALCPHTLFNRPMIFSAEQVVAACVHNYQGSSVIVSVDGDSGIAFSDGDVLRLRKSPKTLRLIETGGGFYGAVHGKLMTPLK